MSTDPGGDSELLICIGAQKAGTTSLHAWLGSLVEVSTSTEGKEIDYFSRYFDFGWGWYLQHFSPAKPVWLDVSPNYLIVPDLMERISSLPIATRIVMIVRDPVERAVSQHRHALVTRPDTTAHSFRAELDRNPTYITNGLYGAAIERLEPLLEKDRLRIVWFDDMVADPISAIEPICAELGIVSRPSASLLERRSNVSATPRSQLVQHLVHMSGRLLRRAGGERAVSRFRASATVDRLLAANRRELGRGTGGDGFDMGREELRARFEEDLLLAERISGLPFVDRLAALPSSDRPISGGEDR